ncbi:MAG: hypothetical protein ACYTFA_02045 [Planctomycetota bacterium]
MEVFVDDHQIESDFVADRTIEDALKYVQSSICSPGHIVVGLRCDGEDVAVNEMGPALAKPASTLDRLEVFTGTRQSLVIDAMIQAAATLEETEDACRRVADLLTEGNTADGIQTLGGCLGVWQQIHNAVSQSIHMLQLDPERITVNDEPLVTLISRPKDVLLQVKQALESQDHVLLADIMQYEFETVTQQWHDIVDLLRRQAENPADEITETG